MTQPTEWELEMFRVAKELLGRGYIDEYYWDAANGFIHVCRRELAKQNDPNRLEFKR